MDSQEVRSLNVGDEIIYTRSKTSLIWIIKEIGEKDLKVTSKKKVKTNYSDAYQNKRIDKNILNYWVKVEK